MWQALQFNPVIFWYMTGETPETLEEVVEKMYRGNFAKTLASNAVNGQETTLHSRCAQRSATCVYLASSILKAPRSCICIRHF